MASPILPQTDSPGLDIARDFYDSPGASARDLTEQQISRLRRELDTNVFLFAVMICGFHDLYPNYHGPMCEFLDNWGRTDIAGGSPNFGWKRLMVQISRDTFKTSVGTVANGLQKVSRSPDGMSCLGIFNAKESRTFAWIRAIRETIESSEIYQAIYRERVPPGISRTDRALGRAIPQRWRWSDHAIDLVRDKPLAEATISGHGATGSAAGWHFDYIIKDDLIEMKHALSPVEMDRAWEWCETARYLEKPAEKGNELWNYTRWHHNDIYTRARRQWPDDYVVFWRKILETDPATGEEHSTFPTRFTTAELQRERASRPFWFSSQRNNTPKAGREQSFEEGWLRYGSVDYFDNQLCFIIDSDYYDPKLCGTDIEDDDPIPRVVPIAWMNIMLLWDPAPSEGKDKNRNRLARNGLALVGKDPWGRIFLLSGTGHRLDPVDMMRHAVRLCISWECTKAAVEEVNFSKIYKHFARYLMQKEFPNHEITFVPQKAENQNKDARILGMIPDFRNGLVYFNRPLTEQAVLEYIEYPYGTTRDIIDGLAQHRKALYRPLSVEEQMAGDRYEQRLAGATGLRPGQYDTVNWGR